MATTVFSTQLQKLRKAKGVKQEQLAEHLGVSTQAVSKWENGSYPDGDLLPRIAKFFDVSIDYLYGNEQETMRLDERVVEYMDKEMEAGGKRLEKLLELLWMGMGNGTVQQMAKEQGMVKSGYLPLPKIALEDGRTGSEYVSSDGVSFMRLNEDLRYGFIMEHPEKGYETYVADTKELAEIFDLLGEEEAIKVFLFMMTLDATELVRAETVASYLGIPLDKVEQVLEKAATLGQSALFGGGAHGVISSSTLLKEDGTEEKLYMIQMYIIINILRLLVVAKDILYPIHSYRNLSVNMSETLLDRNRLLELLKKNKTEEERHE
ncbi:MAG: helix-turn-helix transcriptional regulator [Lachnospiraceae bacterium]|nr:helix-turn-helix transcriptional regulator [Lachnospiraceae bacterium]